MLLTVRSTSPISFSVIKIYHAKLLQVCSRNPNAFHFLISRSNLHIQLNTWSATISTIICQSLIYIHAYPLSFKWPSWAKELATLWNAHNNFTYLCYLISSLQRSHSSLSPIILQQTYISNTGTSIHCPKSYRVWSSGLSLQSPLSQFSRITAFMVLVPSSN